MQTQNSLQDVYGVSVGNASDEARGTGVTVVFFPTEFANAVVDVRGGAPCTRETDTLSRGSTLGIVHAIVLTGGSVFGLDAASETAHLLSRSGVGIRIPNCPCPIPIVPAAAIFDALVDFPASCELAHDDASHASSFDEAYVARPSPWRSLGARAAFEALKGNPYGDSVGSIGAGVGATTVNARGGVGQASVVIQEPPKLVVAALVVNNAAGSSLHNGGPCFLAGTVEKGDEYGAIPPSATRDEGLWRSKVDLDEVSASGRDRPNTIVGVVAVGGDDEESARDFGMMTRSQLDRVATMAHDGIARAIRPAHTPFDGDTLFVAQPYPHSANESAHSVPEAMVARIGAAAADCVARSLARAVFAAAPLPANARDGAPQAFCERFGKK